MKKNVLVHSKNLNLIQLKNSFSILKKKVVIELKWFKLMVEEMVGEFSRNGSFSRTI